MVASSHAGAKNPFGRNFVSLSQMSVHMTATSWRAVHPCRMVWFLCIDSTRHPKFSRAAVLSASVSGKSEESCPANLAWSMLKLHRDLQLSPPAGRGAMTSCTPSPGRCVLCRPDIGKRTFPRLSSGLHAPRFQRHPCQPARQDPQQPCRQPRRACCGRAHDQGWLAAPGPECTQA